MTQTQDEQKEVTSVQDNMTNSTTEDTNQLVNDGLADNTVAETTSDNIPGPSHDWLLEADEIQGDTLIESGKEFISWTLNTGVEKVKWIWQAWIEWVKSAASQWVESVKDTLEKWWDILKETSQSAIEGIKGVWQDIKEWFWNVVAWVTSGEWVLESGKAVVQWTVTTTANVVGNVASNVMDTWTSVVNWAVWAVSNVVTSAWNVVKNSVNDVAWAVLPWQVAQKVENFQDKVSQWAQDLWVKARETLQETWQKAKWFFANLRDNFKSAFSSKDAQKVMDEVNAPIEIAAQQPAAPQAQQPAAPQVQQPAAPQVQQPVAPQVQQPVEVQPWDIQQPTPTNPAV